VVQSLLCQLPVCLESTLPVIFPLYSKINATGFLKAVQELGLNTFGNMLRTPIEGNLPLDTVLKTMIISLDSIKIVQGWTTFSNMYKLILPTESTASSLCTSFLT
jgi:hypothetical protein